MRESESNADAALRIERLSTPLGDLLVVTDPTGLVRAVEWRDFEDRMHRYLAAAGRPGRGVLLSPARVPTVAARALEAYFAGDVKSLNHLRTTPAGSPFRSSVWQAVRSVPAGGTVSYGGLAALIGRPGSSRAVGGALGANPVCVIVPCHRVIDTKGRLTGYAGGTERKRWLLAHEAACTAERWPVLVH